MRPAGQRFDALAPRADSRVVLADVEAEFLGRIMEVARKRYVRDGRPLAEHEFAAFEPLAHDAKIAVDAALEERQHGRIARRLGEVLQEAVWPEKSIDLLIIEDDPAQRFQLFLFTLRQIFPRPLRQIIQDHAGLAELLPAMHQHRRFAHFVDLCAVLRRARLAAEEFYLDRLPVGTDQIEHQRGSIGVAGLGETIKLIFGHG